jgi:peptide/nickel transport system permease protein
MDVGNYVIRRLITFVLMIFMITGLIYFMLRLPGDPFKQMEVLQPREIDSINRMREWSGFNDPWYIGYFKWMRRIVFEWDWGKSIYSKKPVWGLVADRLPITMKIQSAVLVFGLMIGLPLGIFSARRQYSTADYTMTFISYIGIALPRFWFGLILLLIFGATLKWLPIGWELADNYELLNPMMKFLDQAKNLILPVSMGVFASVAGLSRYMRTSMLEVIRQDYVRTARSKGLSENRVIYKHALRNAMIPIITILTFMLKSLFSSSVITERIFNVNGMGKLMFDAVIKSDIPISMGVLTFFAILTLISLLLQDIFYAVVDPRIRYS